MEHVVAMLVERASRPVGLEAAFHREGKYKLSEVCGKVIMRLSRSQSQCIWAQDNEGLVCTILKSAIRADSRLARPRERHYMEGANRPQNQSDRVAGRHLIG